MYIEGFNKNWMFGGDVSENLMIIKGIDILEQVVVLDKRERLPGF